MAVEERVGALEGLPLDDRLVLGVGSAPPERMYPAWAGHLSTWRTSAFVHARAARTVPFLDVWLFVARPLSFSARYVRVTNIAQNQNGNGTYWRWVSEIQVLAQCPNDPMTW